VSESYFRISQLASTKEKPGLFPVTAVTIWRWARDGRFPKPIRLSNKVTVWDAQEVRAWEARQKAAAR